MSAEVKPCKHCNSTRTEPQEYSSGPCTGVLSSLPWYVRVCNGCGYTSEASRTQVGADENWNRRSTVSIETAQKLADSIMAYIDEFGLDHEDDDCPDDDTCKCERRQAINEALAAFNKEKGRQG